MKKMRQGKAGKPRLEISMEPESNGDCLEVQYCVMAGEKELFLVDDPGFLIAEWPHEPGACSPPEDCIPLVKYYMAVLERPPEYSYGGYKTPALKTLKPNGTHKGAFCVEDHLTEYGLGPEGEIQDVAIDLPQRFDLQMVAGYGEAPLRIEPGDMHPEKAVLKWQKGLNSNRLKIFRSLSWSLT